MKLAFALALCAAVAGCASTANAPSQFYRSAGQSDQIAIAGTLKQGFGLSSPSNEVAITINGQRVAGGSFNGGSAEFAGTYESKPVIADCSAVAAGSIGHQLLWGSDRVDVKCLVFVAGERAASFLLVP